MAFRRRRMLAPIVTVKHYVGQPKVVLGLGLAQTLEIAKTVAAPVSTNREDVSEGSMIKSVHFEYWLAGQGASNSPTQFVMIIEKSPSNTINPTFADMLNLGGYANKKNILYTTQGIVQEAAGSGTIPVIRDWLLIPKGKQRMGQEDRILITFATVETQLVFCGISTYKEYQ